MDEARPWRGVGVGGQGGLAFNERGNLSLVRGGWRVGKDVGEANPFWGLGQ